MAARPISRVALLFGPFSRTSPAARKIFRNGFWPMKIKPPTTPLPPTTPAPPTDEAAGGSAARPALEVVYLPTDSLVPYGSNARTHSAEQVDQIAASIREFGWTNPILLDGALGV